MFNTFIKGQGCTRRLDTNELVAEKLEKSK
jgi:hypothetical protein